MSVVTNVLFKTSSGDKTRLSALNAVFQAGQEFKSCDHDSLPGGWYAGNKFLECEICPGAFNHLDLKKLISAIGQVQWDDPASVQLFVQEQGEHRLKEVDLQLAD